MEYTAEDLIAHRLQRGGILVAKPKFDREGTDLIGLVGVSDGAKFCRIQCKGRSLTSSPNSNIKIRCSYATDGFVAFLFVDTGESTETHLYCFTGQEVRGWKSDGTDYCLTISQSTFARDLEPFALTDERIATVKRLIISVGVIGEFNTTLYGFINSTLEDATASISGTSTPPEQGK